MTKKKYNSELTFEESQHYLNEFDTKVRNTRYVLCVDFEATCDSDKTKIPRHESEIIEFGAVMVDTTTGERVFEFSHFVKPVIHPTLTPFCTELTTITQEQVDGGVSFSQAIELLDIEIACALGDQEFVWVSWGQYDYNQFHNEVKRNNPGCNNYLGQAYHLNLKAANAAFGKCNQKGLDRAVKDRGLTWYGTHHRGIDDAINVGNVLLNILGK